jgi:RNA polymerase-binding transcription factor DksA
MAKPKKVNTKAKAKKAAPKKAAPVKARKASTPASAAKKASPAKKQAAKKLAAKKPAAKTPPSNKASAKPSPKPSPKAFKGNSKSNPGTKPKPPVTPPPVSLTPFLKKQRDRLLQLRDGMLDSMSGVARDSLRSRAEGSEASAFGMHQADAGSDAYDRDFALSLLSQEQDALYEIDEALKRIELGSYGVCEMSGKSIPHARLEAIPFARYTVDCQSQLEKQNKLMRTRQPVTSLFGLTEEEGGAEGEEEEPIAESKE